MISNSNWFSDEDEGPLDFSVKAEHNCSTKSLPALSASSDGSTTSNPSPSSSVVVPRKKGRPLPEELKDDAYWERRRKNNEAAKRSRDARRAKEYEVMMRARSLEQENLALRVEVARLQAELAKLLYPSLSTSVPSAINGHKNRVERETCCRHDLASR